MTLSHRVFHPICRGQWAAGVASACAPVRRSGPPRGNFSSNGDTGSLRNPLVSSVVRGVIRCPLTVRSDIAAVHGQKRSLLRHGQSRVGAQRGFRCIVVASGPLRYQASLCEQCFGGEVQSLGDRLQPRAEGSDNPRSI